jgi:hypothetical protein
LLQHGSGTMPRDSVAQIGRRIETVRPDGLGKINQTDIQ